MIESAAILAGAFLVAIALTGWTRRIALHRGILDNPDLELVGVYGDALRQGDPPNSTKTNPISPIAVNRNSMIMSTVVFNQRPTAIAPS